MNSILNHIFRHLDSLNRRITILATLTTVYIITSELNKKNQTKAIKRLEAEVRELRGKGV